MKRHLIFSAFIFAAGSMLAQTTAVFHLTTGETKKILIADIDSMAFNGLDEAALNGHKMVDMGLSVNWAPVNIDINKENFEAEAPEAWGSYAGWGDATGLKKSDVADDYLGADPPQNVCATKNDIVRTHWGGAWRLPTFEEFNEFSANYDLCMRQWSTKNNRHGYYIKGPNDNIIFLPAAGFYYSTYSTETTAADEDVDGGYWTGESFISTDGKSRARYLFFLKDYFGLVFDTRAYRQSVRPCIQREVMVRQGDNKCDFIPLDKIEKITFE